MDLQDVAIRLAEKAFTLDANGEQQELSLELARTWWDASKWAYNDKIVADLASDIDSYRADLECDERA